MKIKFKQIQTHLNKDFVAFNLKYILQNISYGSLEKLN